MALEQWLLAAMWLPAAGPRALSRVLAQARQVHDELGLGGVAVFDGEQVMHLLHAEPEQLAAAWVALAVLPGYSNLQRLCASQAPTLSALPRCVVGVVEPLSLAAVQEAGCAQGEAAALAVFLRLLAAADLA